MYISRSTARSYRQTPDGPGESSLPPPPHVRCYLALTRGLFSSRVRDRVDLVEGCSSADGGWQTDGVTDLRRRWWHVLVSSLLGDLVFILIGIYGTVAHLRHDLFIEAGRPEIQKSCRRK